MAAPVNTVQTFAGVGIREQLSDVISNIAPTETPFHSAIKKGTAKSRKPEWLRDTLRNPNPANATIEGDDAVGNTMGQPERLSNIVQLFQETVIVSDTMRAVDTAGRSDELKYQVAKSAKASKRDVEMRLTGNYPSVLGNGTTAGQMAGAEAWITSNTERGATGANGGFQSGTSLVTAATDGTARTFTEALMKSALQKTWNNGGEPTVVLMSGSKKQLASAFAGIAQQTNEVNAAAKLTIVGSADVYKSDFGQHKLVPTRFIGASATRTPVNGLYAGASVLIITPDTWEAKYLQPWSVLELARTGHAEKRLLKAELTLCCKDERGNAVVSDLS